ncbi:MAG TPA: hypothetical protein VJ850_09480 [Candidatus Limnocylindrales bacterium]|nr:hypothetical protein [Candidatus Limnocylindrales bacterium]
MIQVAPNRSQNGLIALAVLGIVGVLFLATYKPVPSEPVSTAGPSAIAVAPSAGTSLAPSTTSTPRPTTRPSAAPTPRATQGPCGLPFALPTDPTSAAIPKVAGRVGSVLFASPVYVTGGAAPIPADNPVLDWNMGLWFIPAPGAEPNLITAGGPGMVIPLALSPDGTEAAVWWWPERRGYSEVRCQQGIYTLDLTDNAASRLVVAGDWSIGIQGEDAVGASWADPTQTNDRPLAFDIPKASFSFDGSLLAVQDGDTIDVYRSRAPGDFHAEHVGACPQTGWSPNENQFVAGCDDMTTAWEVYLVCCDAGMETRSVAIPKPPSDTFLPGWENQNRAIGFTRNGDIRIFRTYGFATGCETEDCTIPPFAWAATTLDPDTGQATHTGHAWEVLVDSEPRLSADASWFYGYLATDPPPSVTLDIGTGAIIHVGTRGTAAGASLDGRTMYGWRFNSSGQAVIRAATRSGTTAPLTIGWPDGTQTQTNAILVLGVWVGAAT